MSRRKSDDSIIQDFSAEGIEKGIQKGYLLLNQYKMRNGGKKHNRTKSSNFEGFDKVLARDPLIKESQIVAIKEHIEFLERAQSEIYIRANGEALDPNARAQIKKIERQL